MIVRDGDTHYGHPEGRGRWVRRRKRPSDLLESPLWFLDGRIDWSTSAGRRQARAQRARAGWLQRVLAGPAGDAAAVDVEFETDEAGRIVLASFRGRPHERPPNWERMSEDERESFTHAFGAFGRARWRTTRLSDFGVNTEIALPPGGARVARPADGRPRAAASRRSGRARARRARARACAAGGLRRVHALVQRRRGIRRRVRRIPDAVAGRGAG